MSSSLYYLEGRSNGDSAQCKIITASLSAFIFIFGCVLAYHAYLNLGKTKCYRSFKCHLCQTKVELEEKDLGSSETFVDACNKPLSTTVVELREPLLESEEKSFLVLNNKQLFVSS